MVANLTRFNLFGTTKDNTKDLPVKQLPWLPLLGYHGYHYLVTMVTTIWLPLFGYHGYHYLVTSSCITICDVSNAARHAQSYFVEKKFDKFIISYQLRESLLTIKSHY
eukprot:sb/3477563/